MTYYVPADFPFDGTNPRMVRATDVQAVAIVEFLGMVAVQFGTPNDEVLSGHPLAQRGLEPYAAHRVENSTWIRQLEDINRVHPGFSGDSWQSLRHYLFAFHDETFECVADDHRVTIEQGSIRSVALRLAEEATQS